MHEAVELARLAVNKTIVLERKGRGRKGYGRRQAVRLFVYAQLKGISKDEPLEKHLRENPGRSRADVGAAACDLDRGVIASRGQPAPAQDQL